MWSLLPPQATPIRGGRDGKVVARARSRQYNRSVWARAEVYGAAVLRWHFSRERPRSHQLLLVGKDPSSMTQTRSAKPLVSSLLALLVVLSFVLPFLSYEYLAGPLTPFDPVQAGAI